VPACHEFSLGGLASGRLPERTFRLDGLDLISFLGKEEGREGRLLFGKAAANGAFQADFTGD